MQKIINVLALASTAVSVAVVGTGAYVYVNKDAIIESVTEKALDSIGIGGMGGGIGGDLPVGTPELAPPLCAPYPPDSTDISASASGIADTSRPVLTTSVIDAPSKVLKPKFNLGVLNFLESTLLLNNFISE